jgi:hypothetical protein
MDGTVGGEGAGSANRFSLESVVGVLEYCPLTFRTDSTYKGYGNRRGRVSFLKSQRTPFTVGTACAASGQKATGYLEVPAGVDAGTNIPVVVVLIVVSSPAAGFGI